MVGKYLGMLRLLAFVVMILHQCNSSEAFAKPFSIPKTKDAIQNRFKIQKPVTTYPANIVERFSLLANSGEGSLEANSPPYKLSIPQFIYVILTSIFVTCLIVADVIGVKIFEIKLPFKIFGHSSIEHTCGMLTFPITFLLGDIINEYYGAKATKRTVYIGLAMSVLVFGMMNIAQALPYLDKPFNGKSSIIFL